MKENKLIHENHLIFFNMPAILLNESLEWKKHLYFAKKRTNNISFYRLFDVLLVSSVMEREVFENDEIAKLMNEYFINVKVDRKDPMLTEFGMTALQSMTGAGGWPMNVPPESEAILRRYPHSPESKIIRQIRIWRCQQIRLMKYGKYAKVKIWQRIRLFQGIKGFESRQIMHKMNCQKRCSLQMHSKYH